MRTLYFALSIVWLCTPTLSAAQKARAVDTWDDGEKGYILGCTVAGQIGLEVCDELPGNHKMNQKMEKDDDEYYRRATSGKLTKDDRTAYQKRLSEGRLKLRGKYLPATVDHESKGK
jgi:hypothetical protein